MQLIKCYSFILSNVPSSFIIYLYERYSRASFFRLYKALVNISDIISGTFVMPAVFESSL